MKGKFLLIFGMFFLILLTPSFAGVCCDVTTYTCSGVDEVCVSTANLCIQIIEGEYCGTSCTSSADCNTITPPRYSSNSVNSTLAGTPINFSLKWQDNFGLSKAITGLWNGSSWVNATSWCTLSGTTSWCNQTLVVNSTTQTLWWKQYANDTSSNWNTTINFSLVTTSAGTIPPTWSNMGSNVTNNTAVNTGTPINISAQWNDNIALSMYVNSSKINNSGSWSNGTWTAFTTGNWSNFTIIFPSQQGSNITVKIYGNDSSNNQNVTGTWFWWNVTPSDSTPPTFSNPSINTTCAGNPVNISIIISDETALSGYIFSTNNTGTWVNTTWASLTSGGLATNITTLNSTAGTVVNYTWYANDTASPSNWATNRNSTTTTDCTPPIVTIQSPTNTTYVADGTWFNVTLNEAGSWCGRSLDNTVNVTMVNSTGNWNNYTTGIAKGSHNVTFCCNDTSNNMNCSAPTVYFTIDNTPPTYSLNSTNSTEIGTPVLHSLNWTDNVALSSYIFSFDNCTGTLANDSAIAFSGTWSNVTKTINSTVGCTIRWCVYANDTSNNWNGTSCSNPFTYVTTDETTPTYSLNSTNSTLAGTPVLHSLNWTDNVGLSGYIFSFCNGTWNGTDCIVTTSQTNQLLPNTTINKAFYSGDNLATTSTPASATTEYDDAGYDNINVTDSKSNLVTVVSTTGLAKQEHERYAFNLTASEIAIATVNWIQYCIRANYTTTLAGSLIDYYYNNASATWVSDQSWTLDTVQTTKCKNFTTNSLSTDIFNSASGLVQFGMTCKAQPIEGVASTVYCLTDYVNVTVNWNYPTTGWANDTWNNTNWDSATGWSNVTKVVNSTVGANIAWCVYANDTSNNWNGTSCSNPFTYVTTDETTPTYSLNSTNSTLAGTPVLHSLNWTDNVGLSGYIFSFCNGTWNGVGCIGTTPQTNQLLPNNATNNANKAYKMAADITPCGGNPDSATTGFTDANYNSVNTSNNAYFSMTTSAPVNDLDGDCIHSKFTFNVTAVNTTPITSIYYCMEGYYALSGAGGHGMYGWWRNTTSWYENTSQTFGTTPDSTYCINRSSNIDSYILSDGTFQVGIYAFVDGEGGAGTTISYTDIVNVTVTYTTGWVNNTWNNTGWDSATEWSNVTEVVNSTVGANIAWCVYANDTSNNWNSTSCVTPFSYTTTGGNLTVTLINPGAGSTTNVDQNFTFTVNATVTCTGAPCDNVYGTVRYNVSSANPDTDINSTVGATPFYNTSGAILQSCVLSEDQSCQLNWTINATGNTIVGYKIGVLFNTSYNQNHTDNATINIIECTESMNIGWSSLDFTNSNPNTPASSNNATDNDNKLYNITNTGTCTLTVWIKGTDLQNDTLPYPNTIGVGNLSWSNISSVYASANPLALTASYFLVNSSLTQTIKNITTYYWLAVPPVYAGRYNGTLYICENTTQNSGVSNTCT